MTIKPPQLNPLHLPQIFNEFFFNEIGTCKKNGNMMLAQNFTQR
jgi:hypothetical protein